MNSEKTTMNPVDVQPNQEKKQVLQISDLPNELCLYILAFLPHPKDLLTLTLVSKYWASLANDDALWKLMYQKIWGNPPLAFDTASTFIEHFHRTVAHTNRFSPHMLARFREHTCIEKNWMKGKYSTFSFIAHPNSSINGLRFDAQRAQLITHSDDGFVRIWRPPLESPSVQKKINSITTLPVRREQEIQLNTFVWALAADESANLFVCGGLDERLVVFQRSQESNLYTQKLEIKNLHPKGIDDIALNDLEPGNYQVVTCGGTDALLKLLDLESGKEIGTFNGHRGRVFAVEASWEDNILVSAGSGSTFRIWDTRTRECICIVSNRKKDPLNVNQSLRMNGRMLATGEASGMVKMWDLKDVLGSRICNDEKKSIWMEPKESYSPKKGVEGYPVRDIWFDSTKVVSAARDEVKLWQRAEGVVFESRLTIPFENVWRFHVDERALVCGSHKTGEVRIYDFAAEKSGLVSGASHKKCVLQ